MTRKKRVKPEPIVEELHRRFHEGDDFEAKPGDPAFRRAPVPTQAEAVDHVRVAAENLTRAIVGLIHATLAESIFEGPAHAAPVASEVSSPQSESQPRVIVDPTRGESKAHPSNGKTEIDAEGARRLLDAFPLPEDLGSGHRELLRVIVLFKDKGITKRHLALISKYSPSSVRTYMPDLSNAALVTFRDDRYFPTSRGIKEAGNVGTLPTKAEAIRYWIDELPEGESVLFEALSRGVPMDQVSLANATGYSPSTVRTYMPLLANRELVENRGGVYQLAVELR